MTMQQNLKIKSAFLSSSRLPNILHMERLNDGGLRGKMRIEEKAVKEIYEECIARGFVEKDESIDYKFLKRKQEKITNTPN